ncbi:hypothetical protein FRC10_007147 [Ceratobasidium sp. 414]|nr:hypothetical protein FRC10_007147 [Ceratobasidium sp. 414]
MSLTSERKDIHDHLNDPEGWADLAINLDEYHRRVTAPKVTPTPEIRRQHGRYDSDNYWHPPARDYALQAVTCADAVDWSGVTTKTMFEELYRVATEVAPKSCCVIDVRSCEGNKVDPTTPFKSAEKVARAFGSSAALHIPSWRDDSQCTTLILKEYFKPHNNIPHSDTICSVPQEPFPDPAKDKSLLCSLYSALGVLAKLELR